MKSILNIFIVILVLSTVCLSQNRMTREFRQAFPKSQEEIISLSRTMNFEQALPIFYDLSKKYLGKILISDVNLSGPIDVDINKMYWLDALELILRTHNLWYVEQPDFIRIIVPEDAKKEKKLPPDAITVDSREVII
ncbi:MAG: hypothetical protein P8X42_07990, partial [Calditrichaceae bacterium]